MTFLIAKIANVTEMEQLILSAMTKGYVNAKKELKVIGAPDASLDFLDFPIASLKLIIALKDGLAKVLLASQQLQKS